MLLFDIGSAMLKLDEWKQEIWNSSHIGIPWVDYESNNAVVFGFLTAIFLTEVSSPQRANYRLPNLLYRTVYHLTPVARHSNFS